MCAIIGCFPRTKIDLRYLNHRGPDDRGTFDSGNLSFGHTRLSIMDLSSHGHQPSISKNGDVVMTYNGEIYNYKVFDQNETCDTVALVNWLERTGVDFNPAYLNGMFAFGAYFKKNNKLVLCRDFSGIKPLCVFFGKDTFAFSSELRGFLGIEWFKALPAIDQSLHEEILEYGYFGPQKTKVEFLGIETELYLTPSLVEGMYRLPPGTKLIIDFNNRTCHQSFIDPFSVPVSKETLSDNVKMQSMSDVEVGVQMSGGIDSSLVSYNYAIHNPKFHGFYVSVPSIGQNLNEDKWIAIAEKKISEISNFNLHKIDLTQEDFVRAFFKSSMFTDIPIIRHPNACAIYLLCEYVRKNTNVKVLLTGEGADEIFGGYSWHDGNEYPYYGDNRRLFHMSNKHLHYYSEVKATMPLEKQLEYDFKLYLPPILDRQDRMSMAHSIEARVPFLSNSFFTMDKPELPQKVELKAKAAEIFGSNFAYREKCGFGMPKSWIRDINVDMQFIDWFKIKPRICNEFQKFAMSSIALWSSYFFYGKIEV